MEVTLINGLVTDSPLLRETCNLFTYVARHDFENLAALCDDDFGIIDLDEQGKNVLVRTRPEWEQWFRTLFAKLDTLGAKTFTHVTRYSVLPTKEMAMSVVEFIQYLELGGQRHPFVCVATIVWKRRGEDWVEARWHISLIERLAPEPVL